MSRALPTSQLILQPFPCFTYVTLHSPTLPLLHLRHSSFSNPSFLSSTSQALRSFSKLSVVPPTSQLILKPFRCFTYVTAHSPTLPLLHLRHSSFSNPSFASPTSQALLILQAFRRFIYVTAHSPSFPSLHLRYSSFSNPFVALRTSQLILQPYVTSPTSQLIPNPSVASPASQLILQPFLTFFYITSSSLILQAFSRFPYVTAHSPTLPSLHLCHSSFPNRSVASLTSHYSPTLISLLLRHWLFTSVTWQATHGS